MVSVLLRTSAKVNAATERLLFVLGLSMALLVAAQVFFRYALNASLFWSEELARFLLVWLTFLGTTVAYFRGVHPGVDVLTAKMAPTLRRWAALLVHGASLTLFGVMVYGGCQFAWFVRLQISPALQLPKWVVLSIIPMAGAILLLHNLAFLLQPGPRCDGDH